MEGFPYSILSNLFYINQSLYIFDYGWVSFSIIYCKYDQNFLLLLRVIYYYTDEMNLGLFLCKFVGLRDEHGFGNDVIYCGQRTLGS